jgi:hypothetical protein
LWEALWSLAGRWAAGRPAGSPRPDELHDAHFDDQAARIGLRLTEPARDRLRPRWLRLRRRASEGHAGASPEE